MISPVAGIFGSTHPDPEPHLTRIPGIPIPLERHWAAARKGRRLLFCPGVAERPARWRCRTCQAPDDRRYRQRQRGEALIEDADRLCGSDARSSTERDCR